MFCFKDSASGALTLRVDLLSTGDECPWLSDEKSVCVCVSDPGVCVCV